MIRALILGALLIASAATPAPSAPVEVTPAPDVRLGEADMGDDIFIGDPAAPVTVVEYLSITCSHCAAFDASTFPYVEQAYLQTGRIRMVIRELPTAPVVVSSAGFLLAKCAGLDGYWGAVRRLLARQAYVLGAADTDEAIRRAAEVVDLPEKAVARCLTDETAIKRLNAERRTSLEAGIDSTPTFIFNGRRLQPGDRLEGDVYQGGELSRSQFDAAFRDAKPTVLVPPAGKPSEHRRGRSAKKFAG